MPTRDIFIPPISKKEDVQRSPSGEVLPLKPSLYTNSGFNVVHFTSSNLPFYKEFPGNYKALNTKPNSKIFEMKENHLLRVPGETKSKMRRGKNSSDIRRFTL